eukprot:9780108-Alexandrium_andersonii.AAC.1
MEDDLQPRRDEVYSISGPVLQCQTAFSADGADAGAGTGQGQRPGHYRIASEDESETEWLERDGPECCRIDSDSDAEDAGDSVYEQESLGQAERRCVERGPG